MTSEEAFDAILEIVDLRLCVAEMSVASRPVHAAFMFVEECIVGMDNDTKKNCLLEPWFVPIFRRTHEWYQKKYGAAFEQSTPGCIRGVILIRSLPIELNIPNTTTIPEKDGKTSWCVFPTKIDDGEEPESWLVNPPSLDQLDQLSRQQVKNDLEFVVTALRTTRLNLVTLGSENSVVSKLTSGVFAELENAAQAIARNDEFKRSSAMWALQMAIERITKAVSFQQSASYKKTHDLYWLFDSVNGLGDLVPRKLLESFPNSREIVDGRYGLANRLTLTEMMNAYFAALRIVMGCSQLLKRKIKFSSGGFRILIKKPPWVDGKPMSG